jgi:prophage tail gpP-like protein
VLVGGEVVITGYVDTVETDLTDSRASLRVEGRDKTGDLVDCSAVHKAGQWRNTSLLQIATDIAAPFGIPVRLQTDAGELFRRFALDDGERAFDAIERAARLRGVLVTSNTLGELVITRAGTQDAGVVLQEGLNIRAISATHSWRERHSVITLKTQVPGDDDENGPQAAHLKATAADTAVNRYRPLVVLAEHGTSSKGLADRARWETQVRLGRGQRGRCTVVGWRTQGDGFTGPLWQPNTRITIDSPTMNLNAQLLVVGCAYSLSDAGTLTDLSFARPEAFELLPGVGASRLRGRLNHRTQAEKQRRRDEGSMVDWSREDRR